MPKAEIMNTSVSEMTDMVNCLSIYNGVAKPKRQLMDIDDLFD